jgi:hypothetical protein
MHLTTRLTGLGCGAVRLPADRRQAVGKKPTPSLAECSERAAIQGGPVSDWVEVGNICEHLRGTTHEQKSSTLFAIPFAR